MNKDKKLKETLTDEDVDLLVKAMKENREKVESNRRKKPTILDKEQKMTVPVTATFDDYGRMIEMKPMEESKGLVKDEIITNKDVKISEEDIDKDSFAENMMSNYGVSEEDSLAVFNIMMQYSKDKKYPVYTNLPLSFKKIIDNLALATGATKPSEKATVAKMVIDSFYSDVMAEQAIVDFEKTLSKEMSTENLFGMFAEDTKNNMEVKLREQAHKIKQEAKNHEKYSKEERKKMEEKASQLIKISEIYTDAFNFKSLRMALEEGTIRRLDKKVKHLKKYMEDFNYKYKDSKFGINSVMLIRPVLIRVFTEVEVSTIDEFIVLFCEYCKNMNPDNIENHTFMYYTIKNILSLNYILEDNPIAIELISNLKTLFELIKIKGGKKECQ